MRVVLQRVLSASVTVEEQIIAKIGRGLLLFVGIETEDNESDVQWLVKKIINMRIFSDQQQKMNLSVQDIQGEILVVSQFTLHASTKKGNRPSYIKSAKPDISLPLYHHFILEINKNINSEVQNGKFGTNMQVELVNDGPVTIIIDSKNKE